MTTTDLKEATVQEFSVSAVNAIGESLIATRRCSTIATP